MTISETLVTALVTGATLVGQQSTQSQFGDNPVAWYAVLKTYLEEHYPTVDVAQLEKMPTSPARRLLLAEELAATGAEGDPLLLRHAQRLLTAIAAHPATAQVIGVDLQAIQAAALTLREITVHGERAVTGVKITGAEIGGAIEISAVTAGQGNLPQLTPTPVKILFLAANPIDTPPLRIDEEARAIDRALRLADIRNFTMQTHWGLRIDDLQALLLRHRPDIIHFSGHGTATNELVLQNDAGRSDRVSVAALRNLFQLFHGSTRCVVLNACGSADQAAAIASVIDCVVGMSGEISDDASRAFATAFYLALGHGRSVEEAVGFGTNAIELQRLPDGNRPRLLADRVDPATVRFGGE